MESGPHYIMISTIVVGDRQRKYFDKAKLQELAESIKNRGLLHSPVVRWNMEDDKHYLVAGERRLRAMKLLHEENKSFRYNGEIVPKGFIPYTTIFDKDELNAREAELEENVVRVDLSWQERVAAIDELHQLRLARNPKQSMTDTGKELSVKFEEPVRTSIDRVDRALFLSSVMEHEDVANAKDEHTAFKIASKIITAELNAELTKRAIAAPTPHVLIEGDMEVEFDKLELGQFDCIIADPPYGLDLDDADKVANLDHRYDDSPENAFKLSTLILNKGFILCKAEAHLYLFCDISNFFDLRYIAKVAGWNTFQTPLIWKKSGASGHTPNGLKGFRRSYETILFCWKGDKAFSQVYADVFDCAEVRGKVHAAQKPTQLYEEMLSHSCIGGSKVLDPCAGSGVIFRAATKLGMQATGIEKDTLSVLLCQEAICGDV